MKSPTPPISNRARRLAGCPLLLLSLSIATSHALAGTRYEDAEDGGTNGWDVYDNTPAGAFVENVFDADRGSRVIHLAGHRTANGFRLRDANGAWWNNRDQSVLSWSQRFDAAFTIYVKILTTEGMRYLYYNPFDRDRGGSATSRYLQFGLGHTARDGQWHDFNRDLAADLKRYQPNNRLLAVQGMLIRGTGWVDDIALDGDDGPVGSEDRIEGMGARNDGDSLDLSMNGRFDNTDHAWFFIDTDFDTNTGVNEDHIAGADYMTIDGALYRIHQHDAEDRQYIGEVAIQTSPHGISVSIPRRLLSGMNANIRYSAAVTARDYPSWTVKGPNQYTLLPDRHDEAYLYGDDAITVAVDDTDTEHPFVAVTRDSDQRRLAHSGSTSAYYRNVSEQVDSIDYHIERKTGGFDVVYRIVLGQDVPAANAEQPNSIATLMIPDLDLGSDEAMRIINPLFKHYPEARSLSEERNYVYEGWQAHHQQDFFAVANLTRHRGSSVEETHEPYGAQFVYSPVIVAMDQERDDPVAIGGSLISNFANDRLAALMKIEHDWNNYWHYTYELTPLKDLKQGDTLDIRIAVRFADRKHWIFTLAPYKAFLGHRRDEQWIQQHRKDTRPIQAITFSYPEQKPGDDNHYRHTVDGRQWAYQLIDDQQNDTLPLHRTLDNFGDILRNKGFERTLIWNFTGTYYQHEDSSDDPNACPSSQYHACMATQLPFQFLDDPRKTTHAMAPRFADEMAQLIDAGNLGGFDAEIGYDWGIAGNIPVDESGRPLAIDAWEPHHLVPFDYHHDGQGRPNAETRYAETRLSRVRALSSTPFQPRFIRLDALARMDMDKRLDWLNHLKRSLPDTKFAAESSIDLVHAQIAMINQLDSTEPGDHAGDARDYALKQPDFLAGYLNPGMEVEVHLDDVFLKRKRAEQGYWGSQEWYLEQLVEWGYTPLVKQPDRETTAAIGDSLVDVSALNASVTDPCFDGAWTNGEWPYGECLDGFATEAFKNALDIAKLQYPESQTAVAYGNLRTSASAFFHISDDGSLVFKLDQSHYTGNLSEGHPLGNGYVRRAELRQGPSDDATWDVATQQRKSIAATLRLPAPRTLKEYTWMQVHDRGGYNKPLIRLVWLARKQGREDFLWAALKTDRSGSSTQWIPLKKRPDADFHAEIALSNNHLTVKLDGEPASNALLERDVSYWSGHANYFKAGVYISGDSSATSNNHDVDPSERNITVSFRSIDFEL